jgi:uncharacterized protein
VAATDDLIPLFPMHAVLFPGAALPLHVFEERYRLLVRERRDFGVLLIRQGWEVGPGNGEDTFDIGTLATFEEVDPLPGGRFFVLVRGCRRFRLQSLSRGKPYLEGQVEWLEDPPKPARPRLLHLLRRYLEAYGVELSGDLAARKGTRAVWLAGSLLQVETAKRQELLECGDPMLAEQLVSDELIKLDGVGQLEPVRPLKVSPN